MDNLIARKNAEFAENRKNADLFANCHRETGAVGALHNNKNSDNFSSSIIKAETYNFALGRSV
jgi:hypothetical protein